MAQVKRGTSPHTKRRHALNRIAELEARWVKLERSRPRTRGKKGAKTRALNTIARQLRAARGALTKARNAIAREAATRTSHKHLAKRKRSEAAKKGWAKRRAAKGAGRAGKRDLSEFDGRSVFDLDRQQRFPFVTDLDVIAEHADEIDFGPGFYKRRSEAPGDSA
jgi:hypothetical protein